MENDHTTGVAAAITKGNGTRLKTDADWAAEFKDACRPHLELLAKIMDQAAKQQMVVQWQFGQNAYGQRFVQDLSIVKLL